MVYINYLAHPLPNQLKFWKRKEKEGKRRKKRGRFSGVILGSGVLVLRSGSMQAACFGRFLRFKLPVVNFNSRGSQSECIAEKMVKDGRFVILYNAEVYMEKFYIGEFHFFTKASFTRGVFWVRFQRVGIAGGALSNR